MWRKVINILLMAVVIALFMGITVFFLVQAGVSARIEPLNIIARNFWMFGIATVIISVAVALVTAFLKLLRRILER